MSMERHRCKLCSRNFSNGRALGGHMRSHLATLPLPPKKKTEQIQLGDRTESDSSSTRSENDHVGNGNTNNKDDKLAGYYGLRENPKRSVKASDPEFLDAGSVVQDRESETESTQNPATRRRSKRASQSQQRPCGSPQSLVNITTNEVESSKKLKLIKSSSGCLALAKSESVTESTPVSSVSDASQDEEVALCLMMLSRDVWVRKLVSEDKSVDDTHDSAELKIRATRTAKFKCLPCKKVFRTSRALSGHKASNKACNSQQENMDNIIIGDDQKIFECPFCYKVFGSGQALGGHKRSHLLGSSTTNNNNINVALNTIANNTNADAASSHVDHKVGDTTSFVLDLNLPAPVEDYEDHSQLDFLV